MTLPWSTSSPPCCASPGTLSAQRPHRRRRTCSSTGPSQPSGPSAGRQPSDGLRPPLQTPALDGMKTLQRLQRYDSAPPCRRPPPLPFRLICRGLRPLVPNSPRAFSSMGKPWQSQPGTKWICRPLSISKRFRMSFRIWSKHTSLF